MNLYTTTTEGVISMLSWLWSYCLLVGLRRCKFIPVEMDEDKMILEPVGVTYSLIYNSDNGRFVTISLLFRLQIKIRHVSCQTQNPVNSDAWAGSPQQVVFWKCKYNSRCENTSEPSWFIFLYNHNSDSNSDRQLTHVSIIPSCPIVKNVYLMMMIISYNWWYFIILVPNYILFILLRYF